jgi:peptidoglycan/LPS O-acetylase OafA/YrhL
MSDQVPVWFMGFVSVGYLAVDFFFCLSGFVIYLSYHNRIIDHQHGVRRFIVKRLARIYPLHLLTLGFYVLVVVALLTISENRRIPAWLSQETFFLNLFLIQNWGFHDGIFWNTPAWSISAEFFAYLVFPFILLKGKLNKRSMLTLMLLCLAAVVVLRMAAYWLQVDDMNQRIGRYGLFRCVFEFFMGCIAAECWLRRQSSALAGSLPRAPVLLFAALLLWLAFLYTDWHQVWFFPLIWFCVISAVSAASRGPLLLLYWPPLVYLGQISYSTYLSHVPVFHVIRFSPLGEIDVFPAWLLATYLGGVLVSSVLLYHLVERPGQRWMMALYAKWFPK